ncbi:MAG: Gfo/Idh/MocA family oxidoreductase [Verrucomicrobia bacterium]|nr:Gfo/Idh/MocA family oxidoreductase [Verrucomicrobiota bacterium]
MTKSSISRRNFIAKSSAISGAAMVGTKMFASNHGSGKKALRIGWVGTGNRGTNDMINCLKAVPEVELIAVADLFQDKVDYALSRLNETYADRIKVDSSTTYLGFDGYRKILEMDEVDVVFFTTPPGFRPQHFTDAAEAGKHIYLEKPGAVDASGVRSILKTTAIAKKKNLSVTVGMQQRFSPQYIEFIKRVQDGAIGDIVHVGAYWYGVMKNWHWEPRKPEWSDLEYQIRTWPHWTWLSGDCCVEQLCHNLDINNWVQGDVSPISCRGTGGREVRKGPDYGNIYDHFAFDYVYPNNVVGMGMNCQIEGVSRRVENQITGTNGMATVSRSGAQFKGYYDWKYDGDLNGDIPMYKAMYKGILEENPVNMGEILANATMTGIIGRNAAYTGRALTWKWIMNGSKEDLTPGNALSFDTSFPADAPPVPGVSVPV